MRVGVAPLGWKGNSIAGMGLVLGAVALAAPAGEAAAQTDRRPFFAGERLEYRVRVGKFGTIGRGAMWVEGPVELRGSEAYVLRFDFRAKVGPF